MVNGKIKSLLMERGRALPRHAAAFVLALLMAAGLGVATAAPASAAKSDCYSGAACYWDWGGYSTGNYGWVYHYDEIENFGVFGFNDKASSMFNNGNQCAIRFWRNTGYSGYYMDVPKGSSRYDLTNYIMSGTMTWNNRISSSHFKTVENGYPIGRENCTS